MSSSPLLFIPVATVFLCSPHEPNSLEANRVSAVGASEAGGQGGGGRKPFQEQPAFLVASDLSSWTEPWTLPLFPAPSCSLKKKKRKRKKRNLFYLVFCLCTGLPCPAGVHSCFLAMGLNNASSDRAAAPLSPHGLLLPNPTHAPG